MTSYFGLLLAFGCDGQALFLPEDNTRLDWLDLESPFGDPIKVQFVLNEEQHAVVTGFNGEYQWLLFQLENLHSDGQWVPVDIAWTDFYYGGSVDISSDPASPEISHHWYFYFYPYQNLESYTEPGTWGDTYEIRLRVYSEDSEWVLIPGISVHYTECLRMQRAGEECPLTESVRLRRIDTYVPDFTEGDVSCQYGDDACSPCVQNLVDKISRPSLDIRDSDHRQHIAMGSLGTSGSLVHDHIQGIGRLSDVVHGDGTRTARAILSDSVTSAGVTYFEKTITSNADSVLMPGLELDKKFTLSVRSHPLSPIFPTIWDHPSGIQAHGNTVLLAVEGGGYGQVYFLHVPPGAAADDVELFSNPITYWATLDGASAAGFVKLASGYFLLVVAGTDHGREDIWFFESSDTKLNPENSWYPVGHWDPCKSGDGNLGECFGGAAGLSLVTDCGGDIYLIALNGTDLQIFSSEYQWTQVYRITQDSQTGDVEPQLVYWQRDNQGLVQLDNPSFRWAGTAYVAEDRRLALINSERRTNDCGDHDRVCNDVYISNAP